MTVRNPLNFNVIHLSRLRILCFCFISIFSRKKQNKFIIITVNRASLNSRKTEFLSVPNTEQIIFSAVILIYKILQFTL